MQKNREKGGKRSGKVKETAGKPELTPEETPVNSGGNPQETGSGGIDPTRPIGKSNPPAHSQFKKGKSGNPKGYPKGQLQTKTIISYWLGTKEEIEDPAKEGKFLKVRAIDKGILAVINKFRRGDVKAMTALLDRLEGKPVQSTKLLGIGDKALEIKIGFAAPAPPDPPALKEKPKSKK
jgi:hypothetical protein